ncbi:hypothetical protein COT30_04765 [Candidatus Micrarchaeota archaeon CG08_land_8_20_14_0_20_49_17]|nr:MAG: hypothetical protein COT30_04765 [Candidatus Micrarchaeota archaeon CG08_land_8_20_14_0_20_49_17]PIZ93366.1 MAG: hypothetical protein COX84_06015 [Candidatus Micrarchaeota archaeon CG_4_10_14_0_2_um_filter_49_7]
MLVILTGFPRSAESVSDVRNIWPPPSPIAPSIAKNSIQITFKYMYPNKYILLFVSVILQYKVVIFMAKRIKGKKKKKHLGTRSCGRGKAEHGRGAGCRGGVGMAGAHKHKWSWIIRYEPDHFGRHGFVPKRKREITTLNLYEIENGIRLGKYQKEGNAYMVKFDGKVLGSGKIISPIALEADFISEGAKAKIEAAGGKVAVKAVAQST